jgi:hypothetical protein
MQMEQVSSFVCAQKAKFFHRPLEQEVEFIASVGWQTKFMKQYSVHEITTQGKTVGTSDVAVGYYMQCNLDMVFHESINDGLIMEETSFRCRTR